MVVGDAMWWRGISFTIIEIYEHRGAFSYQNDHYRNTSMVADARWHQDINTWALNEVEGVMPEVVDGKIVFPDLPTCFNCGAVTYRRNICTNCRNIGITK